MSKNEEFKMGLWTGAIIVFILMILLQMFFPLR